jgi:hypothetical protein
MRMDKSSAITITLENSLMTSSRLSGGIVRGTVLLQLDSIPSHARELSIRQKEQSEMLCSAE